MAKSSKKSPRVTVKAKGAGKAKAVKSGARKTVLKASVSSAKKSAIVAERVVEYKLFCEDSVRSLEDQVNYYITKGWSPVGGVVLQGSNNFMQTMIRRED